MGANGSFWFTAILFMACRRLFTFPAPSENVGVCWCSKQNKSIANCFWKYNTFKTKHQIDLTWTVLIVQLTVTHKYWNRDGYGSCKHESINGTSKTPLLVHSYYGFLIKLRPLVRLHHQLNVCITRGTHRHTIHQSKMTFTRKKFHSNKASNTIYVCEIRIEKKPPNIGIRGNSLFWRKWKNVFCCKENAVNHVVQIKGNIAFCLHCSIASYSKLWSHWVSHLFFLQNSALKKQHLRTVRLLMNCSWNKQWSMSFFSLPLPFDWLHNWLYRC